VVALTVEDDFIPNLVLKMARIDLLVAQECYDGGFDLKHASSFHMCCPEACGSSGPSGTPLMATPIAKLSSVETNLKSAIQVA
jgi:hypothetical protein